MASEQQQQQQHQTQSAMAWLHKKKRNLIQTSSTSASHRMTSDDESGTRKSLSSTGTGGASHGSKSRSKSPPISRREGNSSGVPVPQTTMTSTNVYKQEQVVSGAQSNTVDTSTTKQDEYFDHDDDDASTIVVFHKEENNKGTDRDLPIDNDNDDVTEFTNTYDDRGRQREQQQQRMVPRASITRNDRNDFRGDTSRQIPHSDSNRMEQQQQQQQQQPSQKENHRNYQRQDPNIVQQQQQQQTIRIRQLEKQLREQTSTFQIIQRALQETQLLLDKERHKNLWLEAKCAKLVSQRDGVQATQARLVAQNAKLTHEASTITANYKKWFAEIQTKFVPQMKELERRHVRYPSVPTMKESTTSTSTGASNKTMNSTNNNDKNNTMDHQNLPLGSKRNQNLPEPSRHEMINQQQISNGVVTTATAANSIPPSNKATAKRQMMETPQLDSTTTTSAAYTPKTTTTTPAPSSSKPAAPMTSTKLPPTATKNSYEHQNNTVTPSPWTGIHRMDPPPSEQHYNTAALKEDSLHTPATTTRLETTPAAAATTTPRATLLDRLERTRTNEQHQMHLSNSEQFPLNHHMPRQEETQEPHHYQQQQQSRSWQIPITMMTTDPAHAMAKNHKSSDKENLDPTTTSWQQDNTTSVKQQQGEPYLQSVDTSFHRPSTKALQENPNQTRAGETQLQQQYSLQKASNLSPDLYRASIQHAVQQQQQQQHRDTKDKIPNNDNNNTPKAPFSQIEVEAMSETQLADIYHLTQDPALKDPDSQQQKTSDLGLLQRHQHHSTLTVEEYGKEQKQRQQMQLQEQHHLPQVSSLPSSADSTPNQNERQTVTNELPKVQATLPASSPSSSSSSPEEHVDESQTQIDQSLPLLSQYTCTLNKDESMINKPTVGFNVKENTGENTTSEVVVVPEVQQHKDDAIRHLKPSISMTEQPVTKKIKVDTKSTTLIKSRQKSVRSSINNFQERVLSSVAASAKTTGMVPLAEHKANSNNDNRIVPDSVPSRNNNNFFKSNAQYTTNNNSNSLETSPDVDKSHHPQTRQPRTMRPSSPPYNESGNDNGNTNGHNEDGSGAYRYQEVVRNKAERQTLPARTCPECDVFVDAVCNAPGGHVFNRNHLHNCSRHRARHTPPQTPDDFWELSFADSIKKRKDASDETEI